jgi:hypothetical protein
MKTQRLFKIFVSAALALLLNISFSTNSFAAVSDNDEFCWKDSYPRGAGVVPDKCSSGQDRIGLLCYDKCKSNQKRFGFDCHSVCPKGMADQGLFCRNAEYGRGWGYPWKGGDWLFNLGQAKSRCEKDNGNGNCEMQGLIYYAKCKPGYDNIGLICRPKQPNCKALGLGGQLDLSCAKKITIGAPKIGICKKGYQEQAGLCYRNCEKGYAGVGPVCWADKQPKGWIDCGMGAAKNSLTCGTVTASQAASVGEMVLFGISLGTSSAKQPGVAAAKSAKLAKLVKQLKVLKEKSEDARDIIKFASKYTKAVVESARLTSKAVEIDIARITATVASIADPTGISSAVAAYTYPKCSAIM